jgi:glutaredoxin
MFTVYTKPNCPLCDQAKALLTQKQEPFTVVNIDVGQPKIDGQQYVTKEELVAKIPTAKSVPQIICESDTGSWHVGGFAELKKLLATECA